jgi:O-antigen/teichoic acid export membrane protein
MLNLDMIMLGWWRTATELGYYSAAQRILQIFYIFPPLLSSALFPALVRFVAQNKGENVRKLAEQTVTMLFAIAIPLTIGGIILAEPFMALLYGSEYAPAATTFQILMLTILLIFPASLLGNLAFAYNKHIRLAIPVAVASIGNVVFNALLIPSFGIVGCSIATVIALFAQNILTWRIVKREVIAFKTIGYLPRIIASAAGMGIITILLSYLKVPVIPNIAVSIFAYVGFLFLLREPLIDEMRTILKSVWGGRVPSDTQISP